MYWKLQEKFIPQSFDIIQKDCNLNYLKILWEKQIEGVEHNQNNNMSKQILNV